MKAIPNVDGPKRYTEYVFIPSGFVKLHVDELIDIKMQYPLLQMKNAEPDCYLRKETYENLRVAAGFLPKGFRFRILDAWRPFALQSELYSSYTNRIIEEFHLADCTKEQKESVIHQFVSAPVDDRNMPPVHTTGGAVDLTLLSADGKELDMGSGFDEFSERTYTAYYEENKNEEIRDNRRILHQVMTKAGFTNLPSEWWHFDYGDSFWGYYNRKPAFYKGVFTKEEMDEES